MIRESKGIKNYEKFAIQNNFSRAHYWGIEQGEVNLTLKTLCRILNSLDTRIEDFFQQIATDQN
jgi:transcriptional regulator with XRE-family HTH domain